MTIPMVKHDTVFNAISATATKELQSVGDLGGTLYARSIILEINGGSTPDWTLDIQGKASPEATYHNIDYFRIDQGGAQSVAIAQLAVNWTTAQHYVIPNPPPFVQLVATRTGGTLTVYSAFSSEAYSGFAGLTGGDTAVVDTELPAARLMADNLALPTAPDVLAQLMGHDGSTQDMIRSGDVNNVASAVGYLDALAVARYNATLPTITDTRFNALQVGLRGAAHVQIMDGDATSVAGLISLNSDAASVSGRPGLLTAAAEFIYNGSTLDRVRSADAAVGSIGVLKVEQKYSYGRVTADGQIKATAGFVYSVSVAALTATPTAGMFTVYDAASETGTVIYSEWVFATDVGHTIQLNVTAGTGIYVGFDATLANVQITVAYR